MRARLSVVSLLFLALVAVPAAGQQARITRTATTNEITLTLPSISIKSRGAIPVSIEIPLSLPEGTVEAFLGTTSEEGRSFFKMRSLDRMQLHRYPPGPDGQTRWATFALPAAGAARELRFEVTGEPLSFARIIIGDPFSPRSTLLGAFEASNTLAKSEGIIYAGQDVLGTVAAAQHVEIPAGFLGENTNAFNSMVAFGSGAFDPGENGIDTVMVRTETIPVGGTTPVILLSFRNYTVEPIEVTTTTPGVIRYFSITASISPTVQSSGYVTINGDGTYQSSMRLVPLFVFQEVDDTGNLIGDPITIDTGLVEVPGFPFWLASKGGRWVYDPPAGREVTAASSNFFYEADVNEFVHTNGPKGDGGNQVLGGCFKSSE